MKFKLLPPDESVWWNGTMWNLQHIWVNCEYFVKCYVNIERRKKNEFQVYEVPELWPHI
jgi:hypothetical protein